MAEISKWKRAFLMSLLAYFLSIKGRINFRQMARYSGKYEYTFRSHFSESFAFDEFNKELITHAGSGNYLIAFDPSHIRKSGKHTFGKEKFWSGCDKTVKEGLEIAGFVVINQKMKRAFHWRCFQTPNTQTLLDDKLTLMEHCIKLWKENTSKLLKLSSHAVVDSYFAKHDFV